MFYFTKPTGGVYAGKKLLQPPPVVRFPIDAPLRLAFIADLHVRRQALFMAETAAEVLAGLKPDVLLVGGKVQAAAGFADHVTFADPSLCATCEKRTCVEICSAQALMPPEEAGGTPKFDREKCVHCGACIWNCAKLQPGTTKSDIVFKAGSGGLHSNEN